MGELKMIMLATLLLQLLLTVVVVHGQGERGKVQWYVSLVLKS